MFARFKVRFRAMTRISARVRVRARVMVRVKVMVMVRLVLGYDFVSVGVRVWVKFRIRV
jgi:hypothetical protein